MKPNVDLTEHRDFRQTIRPRILIRGISKYPWSNNDYLSDDDSNPENELILTGSKEMREYKRNYLDSIDHHHCQRCGSKINIMPWKIKVINNDLCDRCEKYLEQDQEFHFPWEDYRLELWVEMNDLNSLST